MSSVDRVIASTATTPVSTRKCPRCGRGSQVEELGTTAGSLWIHCGVCGHVWRRLRSGIDPFALILASQVVLPPGRGERRAPRFPIRLFLRYRVGRRADWQSGLTENISQSGILFHTHEPPSPGTSVDLIVVLPGRTAGESETQIHSAGEVVRTEPAAAQGSRAAVAVAVRGYQISTS